ncbi:MAG: ribose-5-phosphate isomerase RpiA [Methanoregulaceae archaeon]
MDSQELALRKQEAGIRAAELVEDGMVVGLGTGSTVHATIERLGERVKEGLAIAGIPTSYQTGIRARACGITLATLADFPEIDVAIDGADQVSPEFLLIKGRGAAHTREKCVAAAAESFVVVVDETKMTPRLSAQVPVEVLPFACGMVAARIESLGGKPVLREAVKKDGPVVTDNGGFVLDCDFGIIEDPCGLERSLNDIPGVVSCGLFTAFAERTTVVVGGKKGVRVLTYEI